jgi:hypothetical protein
MMLRLSSHGTNNPYRGFLVRCVVAPRPGIPKPHVGDDVQRRRFRATVIRRDAEQQLLFVLGLLGCLDEDVEISVIFECVCVNYVVFPLVPLTFCVFLDKLFVGETALGEFVEELHVS